MCETETETKTTNESPFDGAFASIPGYSNLALGLVSFSSIGYVVIYLKRKKKPILN